MKIQTYDLGDTIFTAGEPGGLYIVKSGMVRLLATEGGWARTSVSGSVVPASCWPKPPRCATTASNSPRALPARPSWCSFPRCHRLDAGPSSGGRRSAARQASINAAGGFISQLFQLRGKVDKDELVQLVDSIGIRRWRPGCHPWSRIV